MTSLPLANLIQIALLCCMALVVVLDVTRYIIPNWLNAVVLALYVVAALTLPVAATLPALGAAGIVFIVGLGLFALGLMGGGDVKLLVVLTLWTGWSTATLQFLFLTAVAGGILVMIVLPLRLLLPSLWVKVYPARNLPRFLTWKQPVPYGVAIAAAFAWLLQQHLVAGLA